MHFDCFLAAWQVYCSEFLNQYFTDRMLILQNNNPIISFNKELVALVSFLFGTSCDPFFIEIRRSQKCSKKSSALHKCNLNKILQQSVPFVFFIVSIKINQSKSIIYYVFSTSTIYFLIIFSFFQRIIYTSQQPLKNASQLIPIVLCVSFLELLPSN